MKAVLITKEFTVNGIHYYPFTFLSKANLLNIEETGEFLKYDEYVAWWSRIIDSVPNQCVDAFENKMRLLFGEYSILYYRIYSL